MLGGGAAGHADALGILLALLAGLGYAAYTVLAKQQLDAGHAPSAVMAAYARFRRLLTLHTSTY